MTPADAGERSDVLAVDGGHADVLAVDGGQSGVRYRYLNGDQVLAEGDLGPIFTDRPLRPQLVAVATQANAATQITASAFAGGFTGLPDDESAEELLADLNPLGFAQVYLAHDSTTSYLGALGDQPGAVIAAGTGVVTLAVGQSEVARVDGWGWIIGDAGSGFWIGRAALEAAMRAFDGRGPQTSLFDVVAEEFDDLSEAYLVLQADPAKVSRIARYARVVSEHAAAGDRVAAEISRRAAVELAHSVVTGLARVGQDQHADPAVSILGKVFLNQTLTDAFIAQLRTTFPAITLEPARGSGLEGAGHLPQVSADSALQQRILQARCGH